MTATDPEEPSACEKQCQSQQTALAACMNAIRDAREEAAASGQDVGRILKQAHFSGFAVKITVGYPTKGVAKKQAGNAVIWASVREQIHQIYGGSDPHACWEGRDRTPSSFRDLERNIE